MKITANIRAPYHLRSHLNNEVLHLSMTCISSIVDVNIDFLKIFSDFFLPKNVTFVKIGNFSLSGLNFVYYFMKCLSHTVVIIGQWDKKRVEISVSELQLLKGIKQYRDLCLNVWSTKSLNPSIILSRNFNPTVLWILKTWLD